MIKKYKIIYFLGIQNSLEYRVNYLMNLVSIFFPIMMQFFVWNAVYAGKDEGSVVLGLTYNDAMVYTLCAGFIANIINTGCHHQISGDIKSGVLSKFLIQPIRYVPYKILRFLGEKTSELVITFSLMIIFLTILSPFFGLDINMRGIVMFLIAIVPAMTLNLLLFLCVSMLAFWIVEVGRLYAIIDILIAIVSGNIFPLSIFGRGANLIFRWLPFSYTTYFLTKLISGSVTNEEFMFGVIMQIVWILVLILIFSILWRKGLKKYVAVGG